MKTLLARFRAARSGGKITKEDRDYKLCRLYGCTPKQLYECEEETLKLHWEMYQIDKKEEFLNNKRMNQKLSRK